MIIVIVTRIIRYVRNTPLNRELSQKCCPGRGALAIVEVRAGVAYYFGDRPRPESEG